ncbi:MAG: Gfo/Idh/MocA family oxidoreductase [Ruminococcaceae bacterium]|nr:Gfo/Idh/MocA family oxidoreductase [Oscillospiraceae bacterium]
MAVKKVKVGVVGCGGICKGTYMENMVNKFAVIDVVGCFDLIESRMDYMVKKYGIKKYSSLEEICSDPEIQIICNLTFPESHVLVSKTAMEHGKHVYCEKMMAPTFEDATMLANLAEEKGVLYTTAPDTFLGAWEQSARKYLDDGIVGKPVTVHAQYSRRYEPESPFFDTAPKHYFFPLHYGGGFPFDLGGYYIHQMINMFGTIKRVTGFGGNMRPVRTFTNPKHPKYGEEFIVDTPTTLLAALEFENGVLGTFNISSDCSGSQAFTVNGTDGTMKLGDPNMFSDTISVTRAGAKPKNEFLSGLTPTSGPSFLKSDDDDDRQMLAEFTMEQTVELPLLHGFYESSRGVGLADMCYAIINGRRPRCHYDIGLHAIEVIHAIQESCKTGKIYEMTTKCERPAPIAASAFSATGWERSLDD